MIGILAYGSLITHPGQEIESVLDHVIPDVMTPFPVEYARKSGTRDGAPTLVPVPIGGGTPVKAVVLVLKKYTRKKKVSSTKKATWKLFMMIRCSGKNEMLW